MKGEVSGPKGPPSRVVSPGLLKSAIVRGVLARLVYASFLAAVFGVSAWVAFSRFILGRPLEVPDLVSLSVPDAESEAARRGLRLVVEKARAEYDDRIPAQMVRLQLPAAGTAVKSGQAVRVFLSLGPRTIRVPDLAGLTPRTASLALAKNGLVEGLVSAVRLVAGKGIIGQGLEPGAIAQPRTPVDILVTRGLTETAWIMPDLIGRDFERVRIAFEARGFRIGGVKEQYYEGAAIGTILRQHPLSGHPVTRKDALSFVLAAREPQPGSS